MCFSRQLLVQNYYRQHLISTAWIYQWSRQFKKAQALFAKKDYIGGQVVKQLRLEACKLNRNLVYELPSLFPQVKQLEWHDDCESFDQGELIRLNYGVFQRGYKK